MAITEHILERIQSGIRIGSAFPLMRSQSGQMTVEFAVAFPVLIVVTLITVNALLFLGECSAFDRVFRNAVCTYGASPSYEQSTENTCALIRAELEHAFDKEHLEVEVTSSGVSGSLVNYQGTLSFQPTLFSQGALTSVFGVSFPRLTHVAQLSVDAYKPGVLL